MRFKIILACLLIFCFAYRSSGQAKGDLVQSRILILLDESSSMIEPWDGKTKKYIAAREIILKIMDSVYAYNKEVEFSLRVFGHQHTVQENYCYDTKNEVAFTKSNRTQMELRLMDIHPLGVTPIAYSLRQAAENDLVDEVHNAYSIILITDGGESCGGDLCEVMRSLIANKVFFKPYIVGLEDAPELRSAYACMGNFLPVVKEGDMPDAVWKIVESFKPILKITKADYKDIKELAANIPSILKVNIPPPISKTIDTVETPKKVVEIKPQLPPVTPIDHLATAPIIKLQIVNIDAQKIAFVNIPLPPVDEIVLPTVPVINHLAVASISEPVNETITAVSIKKVIPPVIEEEKLVLPPVDKIDHIGIAPIIELAGVTLHSKVLKLEKLPLPPDIEPEAPPMPAVTSIMHMKPIGTLNYEFTAPPITQIALVHPILPPADEIESIVLPKVPPILHLKPANIKLQENLIASTEPLKLVKPIMPPIEERETPVLPLVSKIKRISALNLSFTNSEPVLPMPLKPRFANIPVVEIKETPEITVTGKIARLRPAHIIEPRVIFIIEDHVLKQRTPPSPPTFTPIPVAGLLPAKPSLPVGKPSVAPGITSGYTVETLEAKETTLMVYFTNGHGKYYESMPQVVLLEPFSNKVIKKFYRTIDPSGQPDPQTNIPAGTYNIAVADKRNLVLHDVEIIANKLNKIIVKLKNCSLTFEYEGDAKRPMTEFSATVIERNVPNGKVTMQKCTQKLEYEPGNYHIFVNTYPKIDRNVDLDFDATKVIEIPRPGFVKFTTELKNRKLNLYKPVNDKYLQFDTKNSSDTSLQSLQIQPGQYMVHYLKDPSKPYSKETVIQFAIKSNEVTEVVLPK